MAAIEQIGYEVQAASGRGFTVYPGLGSYLTPGQYYIYTNGPHQELHGAVWIKAVDPIGHMSAPVLVELHHAYPDPAAGCGVGGGHGSGGGMTFVLAALAAIRLRRRQRHRRELLSAPLQGRSVDRST